MEDEECMLTNPRVDDSDDAVTICGVFTNSKVHHGVPLICRILSEIDDWACPFSARIRVGKRVWFKLFFNFQPTTRQTHNTNRRLA